MKFTVISNGYFDSSGSTIEFSAFTNKAGQTYLQQEAIAQHGDLVIGLGAQILGPQILWSVQARNLEDLLRDEIG